MKYSKKVWIIIIIAILIAGCFSYAMQRCKLEPDLYCRASGYFESGIDFFMPIIIFIVCIAFAKFIMPSKWLCDKCNKKFNSKKKCEEHEKSCN